MITIISRENIEEYYSRVLPGLTRTLEETSLGHTWTIEGLLNRVVNYISYILYQEETGYSVVFSVTELPASKVIYTFWSGQNPENKTPVDHVEVEAYLDYAARHFNCSSVHVEGRKGWEKVGGPLGYREDSRVYVKEVIYELPEIQPVASDGCEPDDSRQGVLAL